MASPLVAPSCTLSKDHIWKRDPHSSWIMQGLARQHALCVTRCEARSRSMRTCWRMAAQGIATQHAGITHATCSMHNSLTTNPAGRPMNISTAHVIVDLRENATYAVPDMLPKIQLQILLHGCRPAMGCSPSAPNVSSNVSKQAHNVACEHNYRNKITAPAHGDKLLSS